MDIVRICECYFICFISDFGKKITGNSPKNTNSELKPRSQNDMAYDNNESLVKKKDKST